MTIWHEGACDIMDIAIGNGQTVQILDQDVCTSHHGYTFWKDMNPSVLSPEGKLWIQTYSTQFINWPHVAKYSWYI